MIDPHKHNQLRSSWKIQRDVLGALLMREVLTRYGRHNIGFLWLFVEPMIFTLGITALWTATGLHRNSSIPIVAFALTGYSSVLLWRNMPNRCVGAVTPNLSLMHHRNVKIIDIYLSRIILEIAGATASFVLLSFSFISLGLMRAPEDVLKVALAWVLLAWFGLSLALFVGSLSEQSDVIEKIWHPMTYLLFPLSGAAFIVDALPVAAQPLILFLPMVHGVELLRAGYFGSAFHAHYDLSYLIVFCASLTLIGLANTRQVGRTLAPE